jgi:hypothetical protein
MIIIFWEMTIIIVTAVETSNLIYSAFCLFLGFFDNSQKVCMLYTRHDKKCSEKHKDGSTVKYLKLLFYACHLPGGNR